MATGGADKVVKVWSWRSAQGMARGRGGREGAKRTVMEASFSPSPNREDGA